MNIFKSLFWMFIDDEEHKQRALHQQQQDMLKTGKTSPPESDKIEPDDCIDCNNIDACEENLAFDDFEEMF